MWGSIIKRNVWTRNKFPKNKAEKWRTGLAAVYAFCAWNLVILFMLGMRDKQYSDDLSDRERTLAQVKTNKVHVTSFHGFRKVEDYELNKEQLDKLRSSSIIYTDSDEAEET